MFGLLDLWMPILLSAVGVFIASSVVHMVLPYHRSDYDRLEREDEVMEGLREQGVRPGNYMMPHCPNPAAMKDETYQARINQGPVALLIVTKNGMPALGPMLGSWFIFCLFVSVLAAYLASATLMPGDSFNAARIAGTVGFCAYALGSFPESIWYFRKWSTTLKHGLDGLIYGVITGGVFGWLWPGIGG